MIKHMPLLPGVTLHAIHDTRFKQGCLSVNYAAPMSAETASANAILPNILPRGSAAYPDMRAVTRRLDEMYGAALSPMARRVGDIQATGLYLSFLDDRFALPGDRPMEDAIAFLGELLSAPRLAGNGFLPDYVSGEKKNLISAIQTERNDKRTYAIGRLLREMCRGDSFALPRLGEPEDVARLTPEGLYRRFRTLTGESPTELYYVGSCEPEKLADLLRSQLPLAATQKTLPQQAPFRGGEGSDTAETLDVSQGKLCMGFVSDITVGHPLYPAMRVLVTLYGAGMNAKLFRYVREKQSLCYSIDAGYYSTKGIMLVSAGIEFASEQAARAETLRQLELCKQGDITDEELTSAREALISALRAVPDSPGAQESYCFQRGLIGAVPDTAAEIASITAVTREQAVEAARSLTLHSTYFLKGGEAQ